MKTIICKVTNKRYRVPYYNLKRGIGIKAATYNLGKMRQIPIYGVEYV